MGFNFQRLKYQCVLDVNTVGVVLIGFGKSNKRISVTATEEMFKSLLIRRFKPSPNPVVERAGMDLVDTDLMNFRSTSTIYRLARLHMLWTASVNVGQSVTLLGYSSSKPGDVQCFYRARVTNPYVHLSSGLKVKVNQSNLGVIKMFLYNVSYMDSGLYMCNTSQTCTNCSSKVGIDERQLVVLPNSDILSMHLNLEPLRVNETSVARFNQCLSDGTPFLIAEQAASIRCIHTVSPSVYLQPDLQMLYEMYYSDRRVYTSLAFSQGVHFDSLTDGELKRTVSYSIRAPDALTYRDHLRVTCRLTYRLGHITNDINRLPGVFDLSKTKQLIVKVSAAPQVFFSRILSSTPELLASWQQTGILMDNETISAMRFHLSMPKHKITEDVFHICSIQALGVPPGKSKTWLIYHYDKRVDYEECLISELQFINRSAIPADLYSHASYMQSGARNFVNITFVCTVQPHHIALVFVAYNTLNEPINLDAYLPAIADQLLDNVRFWLAHPTSEEERGWPTISDLRGSYGILRLNVGWQSSVSVGSPWRILIRNYRSPNVQLQIYHQDSPTSPKKQWLSAFGRQNGTFIGQEHAELKHAGIYSCQVGSPCDECKVMQCFFPRRLLVTNIRNFLFLYLSRRLLGPNETIVDDFPKSRLKSGEEVFVYCVYLRRRGFTSNERLLFQYHLLSDVSDHVKILAYTEERRQYRASEDGTTVIVPFRIVGAISEGAHNILSVRCLVDLDEVDLDPTAMDSALRSPHLSVVRKIQPEIVTRPIVFQQLVKTSNPKLTNWLRNSLTEATNPLVFHQTWPPSPFAEALVDMEILASLGVPRGWIGAVLFLEHGQTMIDEPCLKVRQINQSAHTLPSKLLRDARYDTNHQKSLVAATFRCPLRCEDFAFAIIACTSSDLWNETTAMTESTVNMITWLQQLRLQESRAIEILPKNPSGILASAMYNDSALYSCFVNVSNCLKCDAKPTIIRRRLVVIPDESVVRMFLTHDQLNAHDEWVGNFDTCDVHNRPFMYMGTVSYVHCVHLTEPSEWLKLTFQAHLYATSSLNETERLPYDSRGPINRTDGAVLHTIGIRLHRNRDYGILLRVHCVWEYTLPELLPVDLQQTAITVVLNRTRTIAVRNFIEPSIHNQLADVDDSLSKAPIRNVKWETHTATVFHSKAYTIIGSERVIRMHVLITLGVPMGVTNAWTMYQYNKKLYREDCLLEKMISLTDRNIPDALKHVDYRPDVNENVVNASWVCMFRPEHIALFIVTHSMKHDTISENQAKVIVDSSLSRILQYWLDNPKSSEQMATNVPVAVSLVYRVIRISVTWPSTINLGKPIRMLGYARNVKEVAIRCFQKLDKIDRELPAYLGFHILARKDYFGFELMKTRVQFEDSAEYSCRIINSTGVCANCTDSRFGFTPRRLTVRPNNSVLKIYLSHKQTEPSARNFTRYTKTHQPYLLCGEGVFVYCSYLNPLSTKAIPKHWFQTHMIDSQTNQSIPQTVFLVKEIVTQRTTYQVISQVYHIRAPLPQHVIGPFTSTCVVQYPEHADLNLTSHVTIEIQIRVRPTVFEDSIFTSRSILTNALRTHLHKVAYTADQFRSGGPERMILEGSVIVNYTVGLGLPQGWSSVDLLSWQQGWRAHIPVEAPIVMVGMLSASGLKGLLCFHQGFGDARANRKLFWGPQSFLINRYPHNQTFELIKIKAAANDSGVYECFTRRCIECSLIPVLIPHRLFVISRYLKLQVHYGRNKATKHTTDHANWFYTQYSSHLRAFIYSTQAIGVTCDYHIVNHVTALPEIYFRAEHIVTSANISINLSHQLLGTYQTPESDYLAVYATHSLTCPDNVSYNDVLNITCELRSDFLNEAFHDLNDESKTKPYFISNILDIRRWIKPLIISESIQSDDPTTTVLFQTHIASKSEAVRFLRGFSRAPLTEGRFLLKFTCKIAQPQGWYGAVSIYNRSHAFHYRTCIFEYDYYWRENLVGQSRTEERLAYTCLLLPEHVGILIYAAHSPEAEINKTEFEKKFLTHITLTVRQWFNGRIQMATSIPAGARGDYRLIPIPVNWKSTVNIGDSVVMYGLMDEKLETPPTCFYGYRDVNTPLKAAKQFMIKLNPLYRYFELSKLHVKLTDSGVYACTILDCSECSPVVGFDLRTMRVQPDESIIHLHLNPVPIPGTWDSSCPTGFASSVAPDQMVNVKCSHLVALGSITNTEHIIVHGLANDPTTNVHIEPLSRTVEEGPVDSVRILSSGKIQAPTFAELNQVWSIQCRLPYSAVYPYSQEMQRKIPKYLITEARLTITHKHKPRIIKHMIRIIGQFTDKGFQNTAHYPLTAETFLRSGPVGRVDETTLEVAFTAYAGIPVGWTFTRTYYHKDGRLHSDRCASSRVLNESDYSTTNHIEHISICPIQLEHVAVLIAAINLPEDVASVNSAESQLELAVLSNVSKWLGYTSTESAFDNQPLCFYHDLRLIRLKVGWKATVNVGQTIVMQGRLGGQKLASINCFHRKIDTNKTYELGTSFELKRIAGQDRFFMIKPKATVPDMGIYFCNSSHSDNTTVYVGMQPRKLTVLPMTAHIQCHLTLDLLGKKSVEENQKLAEGQVYLYSTQVAYLHCVFQKNLSVLYDLINRATYSMLNNVTGKIRKLKRPILLTEETDSENIRKVYQVISPNAQEYVGPVRVSCLSVFENLTSTESTSGWNGSIQIGCHRWFTILEEANGVLDIKTLSDNYEIQPVPMGSEFLCTGGYGIPKLTYSWTRVRSGLYGHDTMNVTLPSLLPGDGGGWGGPTRPFLDMPTRDLETDGPLLRVPKDPAYRGMSYLYLCTASNTIHSVRYTIRKEIYFTVLICPTDRVRLDFSILNEPRLLSGCKVLGSTYSDIQHYGYFHLTLIRQVLLGLPFGADRTRFSFIYRTKEAVGNVWKPNMKVKYNRTKFAGLLSRRKLAEELYSSTRKPVSGTRACASPWIDLWAVVREVNTLYEQGFTRNPVFWLTVDYFVKLENDSKMLNEMRKLQKYGIKIILSFVHPLNETPYEEFNERLIRILQPMKFMNLLPYFEGTTTCQTCQFPIQSNRAKIQRGEVFDAICQAADSRPVEPIEPPRLTYSVSRKFWFHGIELLVTCTETPVVAVRTRMLTELVMVFDQRKRTPSPRLSPLSEQRIVLACTGEPSDRRRSVTVSVTLRSNDSNPLILCYQRSGENEPKM
ncbi:hypothetical protein AHF37_00609 [Paragonimus kellicotti]|nr:hypothetical protein AHF37_00609 [Paragonimus kellicotti]